MVVSNMFQLQIQITIAADTNYVCNGTTKRSTRFNCNSTSDLELHLIWQCESYIVDTTSYTDTHGHEAILNSTFCNILQIRLIPPQLVAKNQRVLHHLNNAEMSGNKYLKQNFMKTLTSQVQFGGTTLL
ncbi:Hypothetical_protein [Hexamita inflata]|uniref:Hypothetical_protein n=1 Tax=Hexamita inflata TaxID=28002 RepID=A0AA86R6B7_9EUKA|nr:Hypothetical protein HINF_LOCUS60124 [Hexamita inflata]